MAPLDVLGQGSIQSTPMKGQSLEEKLKKRGVGGLSFEVDSCVPSPKLSFERSVGGESRRSGR